MRVFITGGSGFVGSAVVPELLRSGHQVLALARSDDSAEALVRLGAEVHRGDLEDLDSLRRGVAASEGVIHCGFIHDFSRFAEVCATDARAIEAMGEALDGTDRPLVVTSGTALVAPGRVCTEEDRSELDPSVMPRVATARAVEAVVERGVRASQVRLAPSVHGAGDHGFVRTLIDTARAQGVSAYVGDGHNRWNAVHRLDAAKLFVRALEHAPRGARLHAVGESEVRLRAIATAIGERIGVPVRGIPESEAEAHFGWFAHFAAADCPASSAATRAAYDWAPSHPTLLEDLASEPSYGA